MPIAARVLPRRCRATTSAKSTWPHIRRCWRLSKVPTQPASNGFGKHPAARLNSTIRRPLLRSISPASTRMQPASFLRRRSRAPQLRRTWRKCTGRHSCATFHSASTTIARCSPRRSPTSTLFRCRSVRRSEKCRPRRYSAGNRPAAVPDRTSASFFGWKYHTESPASHNGIVSPRGISSFLRRCRHGWRANAGCVRPIKFHFPHLVQTLKAAKFIPP